MNRLHSIRTTLQEANEYYNMLMETGGSLNMDRVGYTSYIKLDTFRTLLGQPDLTIDDLAMLLRSARQEVFKPDAKVPKPVVANVANDPGQDWATLMARIVINSANEDRA